MCTATSLIFSTGLMPVCVVIRPRRMKLAPSFFEALMAASGSLRKCASISAWAICARISSCV